MLSKVEAHSQHRKCLRFRFRSGEPAVASVPLAAAHAVADGPASEDGEPGTAAKGDAGQLSQLSGIGMSEGGASSPDGVDDCAAGLMSAMFADESPDGRLRPCSLSYITLPSAHI